VIAAVGVDDREGILSIQRDQGQDPPRRRVRAMTRVGMPAIR
jgi:hypothetical protein